MHGTLLQPSVDLAGQFVALDFLFTDGKQADPRPAVTESRAEIDFAHHRELHQMLRLRVDVRANIEQNGYAALGVWKRSSQSHAVHRFQCAEEKLRHGHDRAGVPSADHAVGLGLAHQACRHVDRAILLAAKGLRRMIVHGDHVTSRHDLNRQVWRGVSGQLGPHGLRLADQQNAHPELPCSQHTAFNLGAWRVVSAHGVNGDGDHGMFVRRLSEKNSKSFTKPLLAPLCPCNIHNEGKPGAAVSFRAHSDTWPPGAWTKSLARAASWPCARNAYVLGSASQ